MHEGQLTIGAETARMVEDIAADERELVAPPAPDPAGPTDSRIHVADRPRRRPRLGARAVEGLISVTLDLVALVVAVSLAGAIRSGVGVAYIAVTLVFLALSGLCAAPIALRVADKLGGLAAATALPVLLLALVAGRDLYAVVRMLPAVFGLLLCARFLSFAIIRKGRRNPRFREGTLIVGAGRMGAVLGATLRAHPECGLEVLGFVDNAPSAADLPFPLLGDVQDLRSLLSSLQVRRVIVAFGLLRESEIVQVLRYCQDAHVTLHVVPRLFDFRAGRNYDDIWGVPVATINVRSMSSLLSPPGKRSFDIVVASLGLLVAWPVMTVIALAIRLTDGAPIFFTQERVGDGGRIIRLTKFRTLSVNGDSDTTWSVENDPRRTRIGRFLRATSLDELPQLWDVLRGDMSVVGPRPERKVFVEQFSSAVDGYEHRHRMPVGMTGWAQVHGLRGDTSIEERIRFDNRYIEDWSLWRDLVILARTFGAMFRASPFQAKPGGPPVMIIDDREFGDGQTAEVEIATQEL